MYLHHNVQSKQGNGNGWFGSINNGGCQNLNSLSQRSALFDFYDSAGGDEWLRSKVRVRVLCTMCSFERSRVRVRVRVRGEIQSQSES